jgi:[acyl-carrier-protein] S-malonyltransferase
MTQNNTSLIFPGQGSQIVGMGKDLNDNFNSAKEVFQIVDDILNIKLSDIIFNGPSEELVKTQNTQPALMAVSMAIIKIIEKDFGKKASDLCSIVAGHSLGEYSALAAANTISISDAAKLLQIRGSAMAKCAKKTQGAMAAILNADYNKIKDIVNKANQNGDICQIANDNSVGQIIISGSVTAIDNAITIAKENGIRKAIKLQVGGAFHSELMFDAKKEMAEILSKTEIKKPEIKFINNISADFIDDPENIKNSLIEQITGQVRWRETMLLMQKNNIENIVEIGSGKVLSGLASRTCKDFNAISIQTIEDIESFLKNNS